MRPWIILALLTFSTPILTLAAAPPGQPPAPEEYIAVGRYSEYADKAQAYLRAQVGAAEAPRVALDLLVTSTVMDDQATALKMRKLLVCNYPGSLPGRYVISQLKDGDQFSALMADVADDNLESSPPGFSVRYIAALRVGMSRFGRSALGDGPVLVRSAILAADAGDPALADNCAQLLKSGGAAEGDCLKVLDILTDASAAPLARLTRLHALPDRGLAVPFENYVLGKMTPDDREAPDALRARADNDLQFGRISEALPLLDKIPAGPDEPRILFWRAWAWAAAGDAPTSLDLLKQLRDKHPGEAWATLASDVEPAVRQADDSLVKTVEGVLSASHSVQREVEQLEAHGTYTPADGPPLDIYLAFSPGKQFDLRLSRGERVMLAYRSTDKDCTIYSDGDPSIYHYAQPGVLPLPVISILRAGNGFAFNVGMNLTTSLDEFKVALAKLVSSDYLSKREDVQDLLRSSERRGEFPLPPVKDDSGNTTFGWVNPDVLQPKATRFQFSITPTGTLTGLKTQTFTLSQVRYGAAGSFALTQLAFPAGPVVEKAELSLAVVQKLVPSVYGLFNASPVTPTTQPVGGQPARQ